MEDAGGHAMIIGMCGIGALHDPARSLATDAPEAMAAALRHRGPDGEGAARLGDATLVHTRLAIIDVAGGHQPLVSEDGQVTVVVNGEIYNHRALRAELEDAGHRFATDSDSEVVVHLYEQAGIDGVARLNGMFAFALWDARERRLVCARDPFGVKPLYWTQRDGRVGVASEVTALLAAGVVRAEVDRIALDHFLAWRFVPAPRTLFAGVQKLAAASVLIVDEDGPRVSSFRGRPGEPFTAPAEELAEELERQLVAAVDRQMMSDVPYGAFLSGGLDSAAIVAAMRRSDPAAPKTFTIGFPGAGEAIDERADAAASAAALGADHHATEMLATGFPSQLATCVRHLEEPSGIPSAPALLQVSEFARRHVTVVLSGQGADEPLGGYQRHQAGAALGLAGRVPGPAARVLAELAGRLPRNERAKRAAQLLGATGTDALLQIFAITAPGLPAQLTGRPDAEAAAERRALAQGVLADVGGRPVLEQTLYLDTHLFLPDGLLIYGDKMSMAHSLEQRVPFLDVELMGFLERIPASLRVRRGRRKWLYREALGGLLPAAVLARPKRPFATPYDAWLRDGLGTELEARWAPGSGVSSLLDHTVVTRLVAEHRSGRADHKRILYCLLELAYWHEHFLQ